MYRMIDPALAWYLGEELVRTGATLAATLRRIHLLVADDVQPGLDRSLSWWDANAAGLKRRVAAFERGPDPVAGPQWIQGPPRLDDARSPAATAAFFEGLSPIQANRLAARFPDRIGPLDGAPLPLRYAANRLLIERYLQDLRRLRRIITGMRGANSRFIADHLRGLVDPLVTNGRRPVDQQLAELDDRIADAEEWAGPNRAFLYFDPSGDGRIIEVFGRLESARHVAVVIPGIANEIANYERGLRRNSSTLFRNADRPDAAVVAWLGYDPPDNLVAAMQDDPVPAAGSLTRFLEGLDLSSDHSQHLTVIGHSYGSVVLGEALKEGISPAEVVFMGSPGVGVDHVSEFRPGSGTRFWAGRADSDPIRLARTVACFDLVPVCFPSPDRLFYGPDPTDPAFGATRFAVDDLPFFEAHGSYFKPDSVSLHNLTSIFLGQNAGLSPPLLRTGAISE